MDNWSDVPTWVAVNTPTRIIPYWKTKVGDFTIYVEAVVSASLMDQAVYKIEVDGKTVHTHLVERAKNLIRSFANIDAVQTARIESVEWAKEEMRRILDEETERMLTDD